MGIVSKKDVQKEFICEKATETAWKYLKLKKMKLELNTRSLITRLIKYYPL